MIVFVQPRGLEPYPTQARQLRGLGAWGCAELNLVEQALAVAIGAAHDAGVSATNPSVQLAVAFLDDAPSWIVKEESCRNLIARGNEILAELRKVIQATGAPAPSTPTPAPMPEPRTPWLVIGLGMAALAAAVVGAPIVFNKWGKR